MASRTAARRAGTGVMLLVGLVVAGLGPAAEPAASSMSPADLEQLRIGRIEVAGNLTLSRTAILATVRARVGELFDTASAEQDIQRLAKLEGVEYAYYNTAVEDGRVVLTYVVVERNLARTVAFVGNRHFKDSVLSRELGFQQGDYLDVFQVNAATSRIVDKYREKGFAFAEVRLDESQLDRGRVVYQITEGPRVRIKAVRFEGNRSLEAKELQKAIKTKPRSFLVFPVDFNQDTIDADVITLQRVYQDKAFLNATVRAEVDFTEDRGGARVTFIIDEGPAYAVRHLTIRGVPAADPNLLPQDLKLGEQRIYSQQRGEYDAKQIRSRYLEQGYVDAQVAHRRTFVGDSQVDVDFEVDPGRRYRIGRIDVTGNQTTQDNVIRRILDEEGFTPGQWYDADAARGDGQGELEVIVRRTAITESAKITPGPALPDSDRRDATVSVIEGQTGSIMFGAGVASDSGVVGQIVYDQRNFDISDYPQSLSDLIYGKAFKGAGQRLRIAWNPGTVVSTFSVSFTEPYLYDRPVSLEVGAYGFERWRDAYDEGRLKGYVTLEKRYADRWRRGLAVRAENVDVDDLEYDAPIEVRDVKGGNNLFGLQFFIRKDTTDNRYLPTTGYNFTASYEQVGGDHTFGIVSATQRWYRTLYEDLAERKTVLETKLHAATIVGDAPLFEKFYAGGTGSLRGFDYRGVSPRGLQYNPTTPIVNPRREDAIGSDWILLANAEIAVPLESESLAWLFFIDAGAIDSGGIRASVGTGLQIQIPQWFGPVPMRFEIATPFMKESEDETRTFSFSVGALF